MIDLNKLKTRYTYEPETGKFVHLVGHGRRRAGDAAGYKSAMGYISIRFAGRLYYAHQLAFYCMTGRCPEEIDHINGDPSDNRWSNLRPATHSQNQKNLKTPRTNTSGFKGVSWCTYGKRWRASIRVDGRLIHLGRFRTKEEASVAYNLAADQHHGEFKRRS